MACVHDPRSGQKGHIDADKVLEGSRLGQPSCLLVAGAMGTGLRTSKIVLSSPRNKRHFAARSAMSAVLGHACERI